MSEGLKSKTVTSTEVMETGVCPFQVSVGVVRLKTLVVDITERDNGLLSLFLCILA